MRWWLWAFILRKNEKRSAETGNNFPQISLIKRSWDERNSMEWWAVAFYPRMQTGVFHCGTHCESKKSADKNISKAFPHIYSRSDIFKPLRTLILRSQKFFPGRKQISKFKGPTQSSRWTVEQGYRGGSLHEGFQNDTLSSRHTHKKKVKEKKILFRTFCVPSVWGTFWFCVALNLTDRSLFSCFPPVQVSCWWSDWWPSTGSGPTRTCPTPATWTSRPACWPRWPRRCSSGTFYIAAMTVSRLESSSSAARWRPLSTRA